MSSVGSADKRSQQDEALRRARETYQERDVDQSKKHSQEIKRLNEIHQTELRQMEEATVYVAYEIRKAAMFRFMKKQARTDRRVSEQELKVMDEILDQEIKRAEAEGN